MRIEADGFSFEFADAIDAFIFDEKDKTKPTYHGLPMKCVDVVVEFEKVYVYIEIKDYEDTGEFCVQEIKSGEEKKNEQNHFKWLKNYLKYKYRDSYLYRHAEQKVDKPVHYICLITFDNALNTTMQKALKKELPVGKPSKRWLQAIAQSCHVVNVEKWNENYPKWPVTNLKNVVKTNNSGVAE